MSIWEIYLFYLIRHEFYMKIALIKETKNPVDNRVAISPKQVALLNKKYPESEIVVQSSDIRAYSDEDYLSYGVRVLSDVSDCDVFFGIKEADIETLIPYKHYVFFGHIAKMQEYNKPLIRAMIKKKITFTDYEYLVDEENKRLTAFGWWAGVVGVYYTLRGWGLKTKSYYLPKPTLKFTLDELINNLNSIELPNIRLLITGNGRVAQGAIYIMEQINAKKVSIADYLDEKLPLDSLLYTVAGIQDLVKREDGVLYKRDDFYQNTELYKSDFNKFSKITDVFLSCHFWAPNAPVYLSAEDLRHTGIKMIGDVTCDIQGSIKSTLRSSTHDDPYYDYNPITECEEDAFSSESNISVMAVDTCPNALAIDTSAYFGDMLTLHVLEDLMQNKINNVVKGGTILDKGQLTEKFQYLDDFAK